MVSAGVSSPSTIQGVIDPDHFFSFGLFSHTHTYVWSILPGIIFYLWMYYWYLFLFRPGSCIFYIFHFYAWFQYPPWNFTPWVFVSFCGHLYWTLLHGFFCHVVIFSNLENSSQAYHFSEGIPLRISMNNLALRLPPSFWTSYLVILIFSKPTLPHFLPTEASDLPNFWFILVFLQGP